MRRLIDDVSDMPSKLLAGCRAMPLPTRLLMCAPTEFDVVDVKNPHMAGNVGRVDREASRGQWEALRAAFGRAGATVELIEPAAGCEDMVFCANQTLVGLDAEGAKLCVLSRMKHASRQREVPSFAKWFSAAGYRVAELGSSAGFEGSGDAIWHPGRGLIWGGYGHRTDEAAYEALSEQFGVPVIRLKLLSDRFYHLDTCLCALDERTALINPRSFEPRGLALLRALFPRLIECPPNEADAGMACNATAIGGKHVVIQRGNSQTVAALRAHEFVVHEVETGEFLKSGGSVFCMKMYVF